MKVNRKSFSFLTWIFYYSHTGLSSLAKDVIGGDIHRKDRDPDFHRSSSRPSSGSSFSFVPAIRESSKFVNSRWLLGQGHQGQLTRGETAKGLVLSASQESMNRMMASQQGGDPTAVWAHTNTYLPHSTSHIYLSNQGYPSQNSQGPNHGVAAVERMYRPRSYQEGPKYGSPVMNRIRRDAPPVPPLPRTVQEEQVKLDVRDNPVQYMHNLARRRLEVSNGQPAGQNSLTR